MPVVGVGSMCMQAYKMRLRSFKERGAALVPVVVVFSFEHNSRHFTTGRSQLRLAAFEDFNSGD